MPTFTAADIPTSHIPTLERLAVDKALAEAGGNKSLAARVCGLSLRTFKRKLAQNAQSHELSQSVMPIK